ncbi:215aa long hypothetical protein [Pyrococcus horikoshii OT3]|uniref:Uncharacterized protein n=1 Tax=Pyrococcus horikoshii (strain ATCC 700860 / DSM 12428 / JCM 9974 / NBRC 100139 / OT-3) TaxID=70601 RepID=O58800_PYRHO|nr:215aa long hypothetical protein [Pyrococcus horikoshii OT3]
MLPYFLSRSIASITSDLMSSSIIPLPLTSPAYFPKIFRNLCLSFSSAFSKKWATIRVFFPFLMSLPTGFPSFFSSAIRSRTSSQIWNAIPTFLPQLERAFIYSSLSVPIMPPTFAEASNNAPVFPLIISMYSSIVTVLFFSNSRSLAWPSQSSFDAFTITSNTLAFFSGGISALATASKALLKSRSPAKIAMFTPQILCTVGFPLLVSSISIISS